MGQSKNMCGNSICQDRRFLHRLMPSSISTIVILMYLRSKNSLAPWNYERPEKECIAFGNIRDSISELKYYREYFFIMMVKINDVVQVKMKRGLKLYCLKDIVTIMPRAHLAFFCLKWCFKFIYYKKRAFIITRYWLALKRSVTIVNRSRCDSKICDVDHHCCRSGLFFYAAFTANVGIAYAASVQLVAWF